MRARLRSICHTLVYILLFSTDLIAMPAQADTISKVVLGTATQGGGFQLFGQNLSEVINTNNAHLMVDAVATKGSEQNLLFLQQGKIDMALVEGNAAHQALEGAGSTRASFMVLSVMYPNPGMFVVHADSSYKSIEDLQGKPIAFGTRASGLRILVGDVLDGLGLKADRDFEQVILDKADDGPRLLLEKKVEALWGAGIGWPGFVEVANRPEGARFIAPSANQIIQVLSKHPHLKAMSVPAGTYKGQHKQIDSLGLWSLILVRPELSEELVYQLARAIHRGEGALEQRLKQGRYTTAQNTILQVPSTRLHPGVVRYYREAGLISR